MAWRSFVAVGDSFTEGMSDPYPDGSYRGWADLVAGELGRSEPDFRYANLAVRGKLFEQVVAAQVPAALALAPDLISFAAGGNDALRRGFDPAVMTGRLPEVIRTLRGAGSDVLVFRFADITARLPGGRIVRPRTLALNELVGQVAADHGAYLVDLWADDEFHNPALWSVDRLHLGEVGHRRVAAHVLAALGRPADPAWLATPAPGPSPSWLARRVDDARWVRAHLAPWVHRRLTGRSSGDHVSAKRPELTPLR